MLISCSVSFGKFWNQETGFGIATTINKYGEGWAVDPTVPSNHLVSFGQFWI